MGLFYRRRSGGFMDEIRCDEPSYLIWKWHPAGALPGNKRENAIRLGSSLRVKEGSVAVFVYKQKNGEMQDFIEGPCDQIIKTANLPVLSSILGIAYDGGTPFQAEVYFVNLAQIIQMKFAVPFFDVYDPRFLDFGVPVAVRGTISFQICDYRRFIKIHRLENFSVNDLQTQIRDIISRYVKDAVCNAPSEHNIPVVQIERKTMQITKLIEDGLVQRLIAEHGIRISGIDIGAIEIDKMSDGYRNLMRVTRETAASTVYAQTEVNIRDMKDKQRIDAENYAETLRIQREENQRAQRMQTQNANFAVYQMEKQAEIGVAGANALGKMGSNGSINISGGMNPAAIIAGMTIGKTVGQNIAGAMENIASGVNSAEPTGVKPPVAPTYEYHLAVNGQALGPFDLETLEQMIKKGQFRAESLVWKPGMSEWAEAKTIEELNGLFLKIPPRIPFA